MNVNAISILAHAAGRANDDEWTSLTGSYAILARTVAEDPENLSTHPYVLDDSRRLVADAARVLRAAPNFFGAAGEQERERIIKAAQAGL